MHALRKGGKNAMQNSYIYGHDLFIFFSCDIQM